MYSSNFVAATVEENVMISYSWSSQETILQIRDRLRAAGFKYWIDVENMHLMCMC